MPPQLLPASAAAFAPRASSVNVVLGSKVEPWLTQTLKRINRIKRPLNSVAQHQKCLTETLSSENAIWSLCSLMVTNAPESELVSDANILVEALNNYNIITVKAYIVHVDMVLRNEVAFKLTPDTIDELIQYHRDVHCVDAKANTYHWTDKEQQCKKLHSDFVQAINRYVYRTPVSALEGLEEDGAGELLCGKSEEVKNNMLALFKPLLPPPRKTVDAFRQPPLLPSNASADMNLWSQQSFAATAMTDPMAAAAAAATAAAIAATAASFSASLPAPVDAWQMLPSSPNVSATSVEQANTIWAMDMGDMQSGMQQYIPQVQHTTPSPPLPYTQPYSSAGFYYSTPLVPAPMPQLPLPSMMAPCGVSVGYGGYGGGFGGFDWDRYQGFLAAI